MVYKKKLKSIHGNHWPNHPIIIEENDCFSDHFAEFGYTNKVIELVNKYPESKFILNYRPLEDYKKSLLKHLLNGQYEYENSKLDDKERDKIWRFRDNYSERIINTFKVNNFIVNFFKNNNILDKLLVINVCNCENELNTRILEKFCNLPFEKHIILEKCDHKLKSLDSPEIKYYYEKYKKNRFGSQKNR